MSRIENIKRQIGVLSEQLIALENAPDLTALPERTVIRFTRTLRGTMQSGVYDYAAIKVNDLWFVTGRAGDVARSSDELALWLGNEVTTVEVLAPRDWETRPGFDPEDDGPESTVK